MGYMQSLEWTALLARRVVASGLVVAMGGMTLGCGKEQQQPEEEGGLLTYPGVAAPASTGAQMIDNTVTGQIKTLAGEPVIVQDGPFGSEIGKYRDGSRVEIICQAFGAAVVGNPTLYGKPPMARTTWYHLGDPATGKPFMPERWIPQNPVYTSNPVPSCPTGQ